MLWAIAGAGLVIVNLLSLPLSRAMAGMSYQLQSLIYNLAYYLPFAALPALLLARSRPGLWQAYRPYPISIFSVLSVVALALLGVFFFIDFGALWSILLEALGLHPGSGEIALPASTSGLMLSVLCIAVLPAVCEEFVFRGAILSGLEGSGAKRAVLASAIMFALLHGSLAGLPMQFVIGVILGWLVVYCDSIYAGLIYHTTHNAATILLQFALDRQAAANPQPQAEYARMIDAVGGRSGMLRLVVETAAIGLMMLISMRMFRLNARLRGVEIAPARRGARLRASEWALLLLGLAFAGALYGVDLYLAISGGGA